MAELFPDNIVLDFNHALAGKRLTFKVHILGVELSAEGTPSIADCNPSFSEGESLKI